MTSATKERLITAGLHLFTRFGMAQVGLDHILQQAELTKTTFYNHFTSKEELIREVIARHQSEFHAQLEEGVYRLGGQDARDQLLAVFDILGELHDNGAPTRALMINAIAEFPSESDPTRLAAVRCKQSLHRLIQSRVEKLGVASPDRLVQQLGLILDGVLLNFQITKSPETLRSGRELAQLVIDSNKSDG